MFSTLRGEISYEEHDFFCEGHKGGLRLFLCFSHVDHTLFEENSLQNVLGSKTGRDGGGEYWGSDLGSSSGRRYLGWDWAVQKIFRMQFECGKSVVLISRETQFRAHFIKTW